LAVLAGLLLAVFVTAVLATVGTVNIDSPTQAAPAYIAALPGTFNPQYDIAGDEVVTVKVYIGTGGTWTLLGQKTIQLPATNHVHGNVTVPAGTADGKYDLKVEAVGSSTQFDVESQAVIVDTTRPAATIDAIAACVGTLAQVSGTASDATSGVNQVEVRIQRASDNWYWNGTTPGWQAAEVWNLATGTTTWSYPHPALTNNETYTVKARATDKAGLVTAAANQPSRSYTADTVNPNVAITNPPTGWQKSVPSLAGTASDTGCGGSVASVQVQVKNVTSNRYWNGTIWTATPSWVPASYAAGAWSFTMPGLINGVTYDVKAKATDVAGNSAETAVSTFQYDDVEPTETITAPQNGKYYNALTQFTGTASDAHSGVNKVELTLQRSSDSKYWDGTNWVIAQTLLLATGTTAWSYTAPTLANGETYILTAKATDNAGNDPGVSATFYFDTGAPTATITDIAAEVGCGFAQISGTASDTFSGVDKVYVKIKNNTDGDWWTGSAWGAEGWLLASGTTSWTYNVSGVSFENGDSYTVWAKAVDKALPTGNETTSPPSDTFTYDECPTVAFTAPGAGANLNVLAQVTGTAGDPEAVITVKLQIQKGLTSEYWNGTAWQADPYWLTAQDTSGVGTWATWKYDTSGITFPDEQYRLRAKAQDDFGQWSAEVTRDFTFDATRPGATIYTIASPSQPTQFAGTSSDALSGVNKVEITIQRLSDNLYWTGAAWGAATWLLATGTTNWTFNTTGIGFTNGVQYKVTARATDNATNVTAVGDQPSRTFTYGTDGPSANINLGAGWNLMSLPLIPNDESITAVLADLIATNKVDWVDTFVWEGGVLTEKKWDPPIQQLTTMTTGQGYWVNMFSAGILVNAGKFQPDPPQVPKSYQVYAGWNLIGYHATTATYLDPATAKFVDDYLGTLLDDTRAMYYYEGGVYKAVVDPSTERMKVGFGYWLALDAAGTLYP
jgi:hypothetical protein